VRKALLILGVFAALAVPAAATAKAPSPPTVICGGPCDGGGGGGWTGCTQQTASHNGNIGIAYINHYLVVSYCKVGGVITSLSIAAHGCETRGVTFCSAGPAWQTGGGVGYGFASFTAKAQWGTYPAVFITNTDTVDLNIAVG
jgi:hypothetical protein